MARPKKTGLDYFSLDVDIFSDRKIRRIVKSCGAECIAVIIKILCLAYSENGYFLKIDEDTIFDISDEISLEESYIKRVITTCAEVGFFNEDIYKKHKILTSKRIQENYLTVTSKRSDNPINAILNLVNAPITPVSEEETPKSEEESTQRKEKEIKEEERRGNNAREGVQPELTKTQKTVQGIDKAWRKCGFGVMSPVAMETLCSYIENDGFETDVIIYAIHEADSNGKRSMAYVKGILKRLEDEGLKTKNQLEAELTKRQKQKNSGSKDKQLPENDYFNLHNSWDEIDTAARM